MTFPTLHFEVAFGVAPGTVPTSGQWVDLTPRLRVAPGVDWTYGRTAEFDRIEAGIGTVRLDNSDRALDPTYEASPYWPDVKPMVRCRLTADVYSDVYSDSYGTQVFEGFVEGWTPSWPGFTDSVVDVPIVDGFKLLSMARTSAAYAEHKSGTRVGALLDAAGWPAGTRDIDAGQSDIVAYTASARNVLNAIQDTADAEGGLFCIAPSGDATFHDRRHRLNTTALATFGDDGAELRMGWLVPSFDDTQIWNDVAVTRVGGSLQRSQDATSIATYGHRELERADLPLTSDAEAADQAGWLTAKYKDPILRVDQIVLYGHQDDDVMTQILLRTVGDRITVKRRPPGGGDPISVDVFIERVKHRVRDMQWTTTWQCSPAWDDVFWVLGVAGYSELGGTTVLGW